MATDTERQGLQWQVGVWDRISQLYLREVDPRFATVVESVVRREIFLPDVEVQRQIGAAVRKMEQRLGDTELAFRGVMTLFDRTIVGGLPPDEFIHRVEERGQVHDER